MWIRILQIIVFYMIISFYKPGGMLIFVISIKFQGTYSIFYRIIRMLNSLVYMNYNIF